MRNIPTIIGLNPEGRVGSFCNRLNRGHLPVIGLVFLGLLSAALLITVIVQAKRGVKTTTNTVYVTNATVEEYCLTRGCLSGAAHQLRSLDAAASDGRCTDFYTYACGGWQQTHPIQSFDVERTILNDIIDRRDAEIERLLDAPISRPDPKGWEWKLKTYYTECRDDYARAPDSGIAMIGLIRDPDTIRGWFLFDNGAANASQEELLKNQSIYEQLAHIHGDLGAEITFGIRTRFDETDSSVKRLEFYPAALPMNVNDYTGTDDVSLTRRSVYQLYIREVLAFLAQDANIDDGNLSDRIFTVATDIFEIERTLADILKVNAASNNVLTSTTLKEMSDNYSFDFVELMSHELGDPSIVSALNSVYINNEMYFQALFSIFKNNNDPRIARQLHNFMRWGLVRTYIEDLSYNYIHARRTFMDNYLGYPIHSSNEEYCTREVIRRFPLAIQRLYTRNSATYPDASQTIRDMFEAVKAGFLTYVDEQAKWIVDNATRTFAKQKIQALRAEIGYASIASDDTRLDEYYDRFAVVDTSHFANAYAYFRFHSWTISNSLVNPDQLDHWDFFETRPSRLFDYIAIFNRLFVVSSAMHEPLIDSEWPWSMNIGSLGVLLGQKLFASIDGPEGRIYGADGMRIPDWWSAATAQAYDASRKCVTDYYVRDVQSIKYNVNGVEITVQLAGEPFSPTTLRHIAALRLAYTALNKATQPQPTRMPGTNFTSEQTFFLAYAQTQCYQRQELLQLLRTQLGVYDERTALNAALAQMPEFAEAFQCKLRDNPCF